MRDSAVQWQGPGCIGTAVVPMSATKQSRRPGSTLGQSLYRYIVIRTLTSFSRLRGKLGNDHTNGYMI